MEKHSCMTPALKMHRLVFLLEKKADQELQAELGISFSQCMILDSLQHNPACSQQCIARCRDLTQAAVSRQVDALMGKKLLLRLENPENRREHILKMTPKGKATMEAALKLVQKTFDTVFKILPERDLVVLESSVGLLLQQQRDCDCD